MGDRVAVMERGRIVQEGTPREIYDHPRHRFVAEFMGSPPMNFLTCELAREGGRIRVRIEGIEPEAWWSVPESSPEIAPIRDRPPGRVELGLRPEHIRIMEERAGEDLVGTIDPSTPLAISAEVRRLEMLGHETIATLGVGPYEWHIRTEVRRSPREGERDHDRPRSREGDLVRPRLGDGAGSATRIRDVRLGLRRSAPSSRVEVDCPREGRGDSLAGRD